MGSLCLHQTNEWKIRNVVNDEDAGNHAGGKGENDGAEDACSDYTDCKPLRLLAGLEREKNLL